MLFFTIYIIQRLRRDFKISVDEYISLAIRGKLRCKLSKGMLPLQDNARVHICKVAMDALERNGYELIQQPDFSPDLAHSDFFLFLNLDVISGMTKKS